jgi:hypothetical protein
MGLGYLGFADIFPPEIASSTPQALLSYIIYYSRELLFVMLFMQFFMSTLGGVFMELVAQAAECQQHCRPCLHVWHKKEIPSASQRLSCRQIQHTLASDPRQISGAALPAAAAGAQAAVAWSTACLPRPAHHTVASRLQLQLGPML